MAIKDDIFAIENIKLDSQIQARDFSNRVYKNANGSRSNLQSSVQEYKNKHAKTNLLKFPFDTPKYYMKMQISEYSRNNLFTLNFNTLDSIILPMPASPDQVTDHNAIRYDDQAEVGTGLGTATNASYDAAKGAFSSSASLDDSTNFLKNLGSSVPAAAFANIGSLITGDLGSGLTNVGKKILPDSKDVQNLAQIIAGYSPNQFFTILFRNPEYNRYQFTWALMPKSKEESIMINRILIKMKNAKAPGLALGGGLWRFPKIFRLAYFPNSQYLYKFKPSVMTDMVVNYAPRDGIAFYADQEGVPNAPEAVFVTCSFMEMEYWLDGDYKNNNNPYDTQASDGIR